MWWGKGGLCVEGHHRTNRCYNRRWKVRRNLCRPIHVERTRLAAHSNYHSESDHNKPRACVQVVTGGCSDGKQRMRKGRDLAGQELAASERVVLAEKAFAGRAGDWHQEDTEGQTHHKFFFALFWMLPLQYLLFPYKAFGT